MSQDDVNSVGEVTTYVDKKEGRAKATYDALEVTPEPMKFPGVMNEPSVATKKSVGNLTVRKLVRPGKPDTYQLFFSYK